MVMMKKLGIAVALISVACAHAPTTPVTPYVCERNPSPQCMADVEAGPGVYVSADIRAALVYGLAWCRLTSPRAECAIAVHAAPAGDWTFRHAGTGERYHVTAALVAGDVITAHTHVSQHGMLSCSPADDATAQKLPIPVFVQTREGRVMQCGGADIQTAAW
jgi:hypothetical protein